MEGIVERIEHGHGTAADVDKLEQVANSIAGMTICALGDAAAMPVQSFVKKFKPDFLAHVEARGCPIGERGWGVVQESREAVVGGIRY
jgi:NADH-quinone oxidoreductase subunit F